METSEVYQWASKLDAMAPDDIADFFAAEGVTGERRAPEDCPVANFLKRQANRPQVVCVSTHAVRWVELLPDPDGSEFGEFVDGVFWNSDGQSGIRSFVMRFDEGRYPQLFAPVKTPEPVNA